MSRHAVMWSEALYEYENCKLDVVSEIFQKHVPDLVAAPWTKEDLETIENINANDELTLVVKNDLLAIAAASLEGLHDV